MMEKRPAGPEGMQTPIDFEAFFYHASHLACVASMDGYFKILNDGWKETLGYTLEELKAEPFESFIHPNDVESTRSEVKRQLAGGKTADFVNRYRHKDGSYRYLEWKASSSPDGAYLYATAEDITAHKRTDEALKESEERFKALSELSPAGIYLADPDGACLYANPKWLAMAGLTLEQARGRGWVKGIHPDDREKILTSWNAMVASRGTWGLEYRFQNGEGGVTWVYGLARARVDAAGNVRGYIGLNIDITERKKAEEAVRESEARLQDILQSMADWVWETDKDGVYTYSSEKGLDVLGRSREEVIGKTPFDFMPLDEAERTRAVFSGIAARKAPIKDLENWNIRKDGEKVCLLTNGVPLLDKEGNLIGYRGVDKDITERKEAVEALLRESAMRAVLLDNMPCIALVLKKGTREILYANECARKAGAFPGNTCHKTCAGLDTPCPWCLAPETWANGKTRRVEVQHKGVYYEGIWVSLSEDTYVHYIFDISERKKAAEDVKTSEKKFRAIFDNSADGVVLTDFETKKFYDANGSICRMLGYSLEEFKALRVEDIHPKDSLPFVMEQIEKQSRDTHAPAVDLPMLRRDGTIFYANILGTKMSLSGRDYMVAVFRDVTERKKSEEALQKSESRYRSIFDNCPEGILTAVIDSRRFIYANPSVCRMFGYTAEELTARGVADIHPRERLPEVAAAFEAQVKGELRVAQGIPCLRKDGTVFYADISTTAAVIDGVACNVGFFRDITESRKVEKALLESEEKYRRFIETSQEGFGEIGRDLRVVSVNNQLARMFGYGSAEKMKGLHLLDDLVGAADRDELKRRLSVRFKGESGTHETRFMSKDKSLFWALVSGAPIIRDGAVEGSFAMMIDITERKKAEEALEAAKKDWEESFDVISDMITVHDADFNILRANKAARTVLGISIDKILKQKCFKSYHGKECPPDGCQSCNTLKTGEPSSVEVFEPHLGKYVEIKASARFDANHNVIGLVHVVRDITARRRIVDTLKFLVETGSKYSGTQFFQEMACYLANILNVGYVCIDRLREGSSVAETVAVYSDGKFEDNISYELKDTPCGDVVEKKVCCFERGVAALFPNDAALQALRAESYIGTLLWGAGSKKIGLIAVIGRTPMADPDLSQSILQLVAGRLAGELERQGIESERDRRIRELEVFAKASTDREMKMIELKKRVKELEEKAGGSSGK